MCWWYESCTSVNDSVYAVWDIQRVCIVRSDKYFLAYSKMRGSQESNEHEMITVYQLVRLVNQHHPLTQKSVEAYLCISLVVCTQRPQLGTLRPQCHYRITNHLCYGQGFAIIAQEVWVVPISCCEAFLLSGNACSPTEVGHQKSWTTLVVS